MNAIKVLVVALTITWVQHRQLCPGDARHTRKAGDSSRHGKEEREGDGENGREARRHQSKG